MELRDYWIIVRKNWMMIIATTVLSVIAATIATMLMTPMYASTTRLFVSTKTSDTASELFQGSSFTQQRVKSYADLVTSPAVLDSVVSGLGIEDKALDLPERITATVPLNTVIIEITVTDESAYQAAQIANSVGASLVSVVNELETPLDGTVSPVKISTIQPGDVQIDPESPRPLLNLALGFLVGLVIGMGIAFLREVLDLRVRSANDIEELSTAGVLGGIAYDETAADEPLIVLTRPKSVRAEAFRQLRTNIHFIEVAEGRKSLVVSSSIPSEGKSSTISNLALSMADAGSKVLLIDCDFRKPKLHKVLGVEGSVGLTNHLIGQAKLDDVVQPWGPSGRLDFLPAGQIPPNPSELLSSEAMRKLIDSSEKKYDVVLIDSAPLLPVTDAAILSKMTGGVVIVVAVGKTTRPQLVGAVNHITTVGGKIAGFVMNKIPVKGADAYGYYSYGYKYGYKYGYQYTYGQDANEKAKVKPKRVKSKQA